MSNSIEELPNDLPTSDDPSKSAQGVTVVGYDDIKPDDSIAGIQREDGCSSDGIECNLSSHHTVEGLTEPPGENKLGPVGKRVLDNIFTKKVIKKAVPFCSKVLKNCNLVFEEERKRCINEGKLFYDPEFPAENSSLYSITPLKVQLTWLRPSQIVQQPGMPRLIINGNSRFDVIQGKHGDCWLAAAISCLASNDELFYRVVPPDQDFGSHYAGIFHFQFWQFGTWVDVVIDDRLPTYNGQLYYMRSAENNEFWSALLEKAYAKFYGSYEALLGGHLSEALEDFTGGLIEHYDIGFHGAYMKQIMLSSIQMGSLIGCITANSPRYTAQHIRPNGLIDNHTYTATAVQEVTGRDGVPTTVIRLRNPWGRPVWTGSQWIDNWNGEWSETSDVWNYVSESDKQKLGHCVSNDGEFWMSYKDFWKNFASVEICNLNADIINEICSLRFEKSYKHSQWHYFAVHGSWSKANGTAAGSNKENLSANPQYGITVRLSEEGCAEDTKCTVIIELLQKYRREFQPESKRFLTLRITVYQCDTLERKFGPEFFQREPLVVGTTGIYSREAVVRIRGPPGNYLIVPSTVSPDIDCEFMLRVLANGPLEACELL